MKKLGFKISIWIIGILALISIFEIINIESLYEDQDFLGVPASVSKPIKNDVYIAEFLSVAFTIAFIALLILYNKKGEAKTTSP